ncbi:MAG: hypothetical protein VR65_00175 [Desulfobulbaceae bacterium BRH_c16a]|nr:MAG: hypothetical protein VR65_00175 [Desulfobulbaceae bacterium BRH_c16a]
MFHNKIFPSGFLSASLLIVVSFLLFGCTSTKEKEMLLQNAELQQENSQLATQLAERNAVTFKLQMELIEKQAEINRIKSTHEDLTQEVKQNKLRRPTPGTKVEAVTHLAEVATDINAAREFATAGEQQVFAQTDRFIEESRIELERGNFDKVHSLATQAMELIQDIRLKTALNRMMKKSTSPDFTDPLPLQLAKTGYIRKSPGMHGKILATLDAKTPVAATGYRGNWIKVTIYNGQIGWIHYSLLAVPETNLPFPKPLK